MITSKVLRHSITDNGCELISIEYSAPRSILAEINTHRVFSRNAASSRAIPTPKFISSVVETPFIPTWTRNQPGMQGIETVSAEEVENWTRIWLEARDLMVIKASELAVSKAHKQNVNRLLEPFMYVKGVISSTEWDNFYKLRVHADAQPEIRELAVAIKEAVEASTPSKLSYGEWHIPYVTESESSSLSLEDQLAISVARCARVSYSLFGEDKLSDISKDLVLARSLYESGHYSPFEHQAKAVSDEDALCGNYIGYLQYRKLLEQGHVK